jgi:hypothetical protein
MKIIFFDINIDILNKFQQIFSNKHVNNTEICFVHSCIDTLFNTYQFHACINLTDSFGNTLTTDANQYYKKNIPDIDQIITDNIRVANVTQINNGCYLPVGQNILVPFRIKKCSYMIIMPIMFIRAQPNNIYLAFYGLLTNYCSKNIIIACPCSYFGNNEQSAEHVINAITDFQKNNPVNLPNFVN